MLGVASSPRALRCRTAGLRVAFAFLAVAASLAAAPGSAFGHAAFLESKPPPGARLETSPDELQLEFTEPLNQPLTTAKLVEVESGRRLPARLVASDRKLAVRPGQALRKGAYRVEWHTVSTEDGHPLEGSFGFGVQAPAAGGEQELEQSPLARAGWVRIGLRALLYVFLFLFAGGVFTATLLSRGRGPADWLVPKDVASRLSAVDRSPRELARLAWSRTLDFGWAAAAAAATVAVVEAADASGGLSLDGLADFLLSNVAGLARVTTVVALVLAAALAVRRRGAAASLCVVAFGAIAVSGHANSAEPRFAALATDVVHLLAAAVWVGGIAQLVLTWGPVLGRVPGEVRRAVAAGVLQRFGKLALPAFLVVAATGLVNALIQLGEPRMLWETGYGRVLAVKIGLVGSIALASYWHAMRLRPRLLAANPHPAERLEHRHWRLLRAEPLLGVGVLAAAALLVAFPLPPRQLAEADEAETEEAEAPPCDPCPVKSAARDELAVAENAGSSIAALWLRREGAGLRGELRLLGRNRKPVAVEAVVPGARQQSCGRGCWKLSTTRQPAAIEVRVPERGRTYVARLPARWQESESHAARHLLADAQEAMRALDSVRQDEVVTSGPGTIARTTYRLQAPDRLAYETAAGARGVNVGRTRWLRAPEGPWTKEPYAGGGPPFRTKSWFRWTTYGRSVRLLEYRGSGGGRIAELALMDPGTPVWVRLEVEMSTLRVAGVRMIADAHFMSQRFSRFNRAPSVEPPPRSSVGG